MIESNIVSLLRINRARNYKKVDNEEMQVINSAKLKKKTNFWEKSGRGR